MMLVIRDMGKAPSSININPEGTCNGHDRGARDNVRFPGVEDQGSENETCFQTAPAAILLRMALTRILRII